jgi:hypothetical protein
LSKKKNNNNEQILDLFLFLDSCFISGSFVNCKQPPKYNGGGIWDGKAHEGIEGAAPI